MTEFTISEQTEAIIKHLVEYDVQLAYGHEDKDAARGARLIALAAVKFDLSGQVEERDRDSIAHYELSRLIRDALEARRCQCPRIGDFGMCWHGNYPGPRSTRGDIRCRNYFERDVPEIDGAKLCGACYSATADERGLPMAEQ